MILRSWITDNFKGNVVDIRLISYSTGFVLETNNPDMTNVKNLVIEAITKSEGD